MRKKLLNNNLTGAISKGGVLYRPGEVPTLTKEQIAQANLVSKLPKDFPFANWEGMTTKQQLQQMQYSGLNPQDQWSLLNSNVPLVTLNQYNQAQNQSNSTALAARVASSLVNAKAQGAANGKVQAAVGKPTVSTSLQNTGFNGQLGGSVDALAASLKMAALSSNAVEQTNGTIAAKLGGSISTPTRSAGQSPSFTAKPTLSQTSESVLNPNAASSSQQGASTSSSPDDNQSTSGDSNTSQSSASSKKVSSSEVLLGIDTAYLSEESRKTLEELNTLAAKGITPEIFSVFLPALNRLREEEQKAEYFEKIKAGASADATWGTELINNQRIYGDDFGTFGGAGNIADKACGVVAIHNANQLLGYNTRFDELMYMMQKNSLLSANLFGTLGMNPDVVSGIYTQAGADVTVYTDPSKVSKDHDAYIVLYWYFAGAHYVTARYDSKKDAFLVYNNIESAPEEWKTLSASSYKSIISKYDNNTFSFGWTIWGIDKPNQPQVKKPQHTAEKTKATTVSKDKWIRMSK